MFFWLVSSPLLLVVCVLQSGVCQQHLAVSKSSLIFLSNTISQKLSLAFFKVFNCRMTIFLIVVEAKLVNLHWLVKSLRPAI